MGLFDVESVVVREELPFFEFGEYELEVTDVRIGKKRRGGQKFFSVDAKVLASTGQTALKPGEAGNITIVEREFNYHLKDIKALVGAILQVRPNTVSNANLEEIEADPKPLIGSVFRMSVKPGENPKTKKPFVDKIYRPASKADATGTTAEA